MLSNDIQTRDPGDLLKIIDEQDQEIAWLREQNRLLTHYRFGSKSEQVSPDQVPLFPLDTDQYQDCLEHPDNQATTVKSHNRKKPKRLTLAKDLLRERVPLDLDDDQKTCPCCESPLTKITDEVTEKVEYTALNVNDNVPEAAGKLLRKLARARKGNGG